MLGDTLDSVMNYPLRDALIDFLMGRKSSSAVAQSLSSLLQNYPKPFLYALMNLMGSHDRPRILNVLAGNDGNDIPRAERANLRLTKEERDRGIQREAMMLRAMMSVPGMPCIYYADEAGLEGCADPFCRRTYPWGEEDQQVLSIYHTLIQMRREHPVLRTGECRYLSPCNDVLGILRTIQGGQDALGRAAQDACALTFINRSSRNVTLYVKTSDVMDAQCLVSDRNDVLFASEGAFIVHLDAMRGVTYFAKLS